MQALTGYSIYPALRDKGIGLSFDGVGQVTIPSRTAGGSGGGFVGEGQPIRVGRITTASTSLTPRKMGVIVPFSRELAKRSTPAIEALVARPSSKTRQRCSIRSSWMRRQATRCAPPDF